jgi:arylsulfatase A-like enzyme
MGCRSQRAPLLRLVVLTALLTGWCQAADKPNILVFLADDQGWGDLSLHGNTDIRTPNIDSLAKGGAHFNHFYVQPVCAPTRGEFLTGRYCGRNGVWGVSRGEERINLDETLFPELLKKAGYATGGFGKWHNGQQYPYHPNARGFDEWYGFCIGHYSNYIDTQIEHNNVMIPTKGYLTDVLTDHALAFIEQNQSGPFFCYLPYNTPHSPMQVPDEYYNRVKERGVSMSLPSGKQGKHEPAMTIAALAMVENIDWNVGRVLKKLDELGLKENTIVLYFSDNGPNSMRWNGDMKGKKGSIDEGGVRSPLSISWPGRIPHREINSIAGAIDLLPTLCDLAGVSTEGTKPLDGISLKTLLLDGTPPPERVLLTAIRNRYSLRSQTYRYSAQGLWNIEEDPGQKTNIKSAQPEVAQSMQAQMETLLESFDGKSNTETAFTVGHPDCEITPLPIRDARLNGKGIGRSSVHPNDSHVVNWTSTDSYPEWNIDILTGGRYEVLIDYTCSENNVGCVLRIQCGDASTEGSITEIYDPEYLPSPDRVTRSESLDKLFKRVSLGTLKLEKSHAALTLTCIKQTGPGIIDLKNLHLINLDR